VLSKGSFVVHPSSQLQQFNPQVNARSCVFNLSKTGSASLSGGTGAYKGIGGSVTVTITNAGMLSRTKAGKCDESQSATPLRSLFALKGSGAVSFK
jgi:hypothetical protein